MGGINGNTFTAGLTIASITLQYFTQLAGQKLLEIITKDLVKVGSRAYEDLYEDLFRGQDKQWNGHNVDDRLKNCLKKYNLLTYKEALTKYGFAKVKEDMARELQRIFKEVN